MILVGAEANTALSKAILSWIIFVLTFKISRKYEPNFMSIFPLLQEKWGQKYTKLRHFHSVLLQGS